MENNNYDFWDDLGDLENTRPRQDQNAAVFDLDNLDNILRPANQVHIPAVMEETTELQVPAAQQAPAQLQVQNFVPCPLGPWFEPIILNIRPGEDVNLRTYHTAIRTYRQWSIISANGFIANPRLRVPVYSANAVTTVHQGNFGLIGISGQFTGSELVSLVFVLQDANNRSISGNAGGPMIAASEVQVIILVFPRPLLSWG